MVNIIKSCSMIFPLVGNLAEDVNMAGCHGLKLSIYAENLPNDVRKRYRKKFKYSNDDLLYPYELISSGWTDDQSVWPDLQFCHIWATAT